MLVDKGSTRTRLFIFGLLSIVAIAVQINTGVVFSQNTETALEELQNQTFAQVVISSAEIDELDRTVKNATQAAESGNITSTLVQLRVLANQIDIIKQEANIFGN